MAHDAIVIGSGASGAIAAWALTARGLRVLMLEAGRQVTQADFDPARKPRNPKPINVTERAIATLMGQKIQSRAAFFRGMLRHFYVNDRDNPYTTDRDAPFVWIRGRQTGGRTHTFGRVLMRWNDDDFQRGAVAWPFAYADLAPFYDEVETLLGLYGNADGSTAIPDGRYIAPAKLSPAEEAFKTRLEAHHPERRVIAWRSLAPPRDRVLTPLQRALDTGLLTLRHNAVAARILTKGARATGVEVIDTSTGARSREQAAEVLLCASPIESVRLLLNSANKDHPGGIGNSSGLLGRHFMDQLPMLAMGRIPGGAGGFVDDSQPADPFYDPQGGIFIPRFETPDRGEFDFQGGIGRGPGGADLLFFGFGQMAPRADNRITLSRKRDRWGLPAAHIRCTPSASDLDLQRRQEQTFLDTIAAGGGEVEFLGSLLGSREWGRGAWPEAGALSRFLFRRFFRQVMVMGAAIHEAGGARMGTDPALSVTDPYGRLWDMPNLRVTDAATFPTGGVTGTTLTIMAQTLRTCRQM